MNAIIGLTYLLQKSKLAPEQQKHLQHIDASANHLLNIINDILDISKIEADKMDLELSSFSLTVLLDQIRSLMDAQAKLKGISIEIDCAGYSETSRGCASRY
jgi:signal transduction histidine kinase